ncbi:SDR family oxidoreductase [Oceanispirochaeta crateris]|uniref:SDR family oxidoreductase n=1 Tax=Oceanispirochaeta crateris TaxID=2518645 RepID=A0A5C1QF05_9SPIO|nr:UDP-glucuronic acid decarboxylase family protein [Oceanispirochaeta crateris]QEN06635.1 SDR family oxidoreductase [Oceanispirochaeta crateris]
MIRILVTGGAGLIGSHLCSKLLESGNKVLCLDNFFTGTKENLLQLMDNSYFEILHHNIINPISLELDQIYNLACPASPIHYLHDPVQTTKTSVIGAINMLELAKNLNIPILQASTSEIYGDPEIHPQLESYWGNVNTIGPRACYDEGKRCAETLFFDYYRENKVNIKVLRIFNTYGPHMRSDDGRVVSNFIVQALQNQDITIFGDGNQTRSFCYVDDIVNAMIQMMDSKDLTGPINIGNPMEVTMNELADMIIELTDSKSQKVYLPLPKDDPKRRKPDITLARQKLNWEPKIDLREGLLKTIDYFKSPRPS